MKTGQIGKALQKAATSNPDDMSAVHILHRSQLKDENLKKYSTFLSDEQFLFLAERHTSLGSSARIRQAVIFYQRHYDKI